MKSLSQITNEQLLLNGDSDEAEQQKLQENCRNEFYRKTVEKLEFIMSMNSVKLDPLMTDANGDHNHNHKHKLDYDCPKLDAASDDHTNHDRRKPKTLENNLRRLCSRDRPPNWWPSSAFGRLLWTLVASEQLRLVRAAICLYATLKLYLFAMLLYQHESLLKVLDPAGAGEQPQPPPPPPPPGGLASSQRMGGDDYECAPAEEVAAWRAAHSASFREYIECQTMLHHLGALFISLPAGNVLILCMMAVIPLIYYNVTHWTLHSSELRADHLRFLLDPLGERRRLRREMAELIKELIASLLLDGTRFTRNIKVRHFHHQGQVGHHGGGSEPMTTTRRVATATSIAGSGDFRDQQNKMNYIELLMAIRRHNRVKPFCVSSVWHGHITRLAAETICWMRAIVVHGNMVVVLVCLLYDLAGATRHRLQQTQCQKWRPDGVLIRERLYLDPLESQEDREAYLAYDQPAASGSWSPSSLVDLDFVRLMFTVEWRYFFTPLRLLSALETLGLVMVMSSWSVFHTLMYVLCSMEKIFWLKQLELQIRIASESIFDQLDRHYHDAPLATMSHSAGNMYRTKFGAFQLLTELYLNYELFRRQFRPCKRLLNFLTAQLAVIIGNAMMSAYYVYTGGFESRTVSILWLYTAGFAFVANLYLAVSAYKSRQIERIMNNMLRLLAHCAAHSIHLTYPVELWRREVLSDMEVRKFFATTILGTSISYRTLISFNAYLIALMLIIIKVSSDKGTGGGLASVHEGQ